MVIKCEQDGIINCFEYFFSRILEHYIVRGIYSAPSTFTYAYVNPKIPLS